MIAEAKSKIKLSDDKLRNVYRHMCEMVQSKYLTSAELVTVLKAQSMKYGWSWGVSHERLINELFGGQSLNEGKFVQCFGQDAICVKEDV